MGNPFWICRISFVYLKMTPFENWKLKTNAMWAVASKSLNLFPIDIYDNNGRLVWTLFCFWGYEIRPYHITLTQQMNDKINFQTKQYTTVSSRLAVSTRLSFTLTFSFFDGRKGQWITNEQWTTNNRRWQTDNNNEIWNCIQFSWTLTSIVLKMASKNTAIRQFRVNQWFACFPPVFVE